MKLNPEGLPEDDLRLTPTEREVFQKLDEEVDQRLDFSNIKAEPVMSIIK